MSCSSWKNDFTAFLDNELPDSRSRSIEKHIRRCPDCQIEIRGLERVSERLDLLEAPEPSPAFRKRVWSRIRRNSSRRRPAVRPRPTLAPLLTAALLLLSAILTVVLLPEATSPTSRPREPEVSLSPEDEAIVSQLETFEGDAFVLAQELEVLEDLPVLEEIDPNDLEPLDRGRQR